MKVNSLKIDGIGGIKHLELTFHEGVNVICGENGVGKTTILNVIADVFGEQMHSRLKRSASCECGSYDIEISVAENGSDSIKKKHRVIDAFEPAADPTYNPNGLGKYARFLLNFRKSQDLEYQKIASVSKDPERTYGENKRLAVDGISAKEVKTWMVNRFLFADKPGSLTTEQINNFQQAKEVFGLIDESVSFKTVNGSSLDILLDTARGDIYLEYLSSGYKNCIYILLGIIKEIEYRTAEERLNVKDFDGVILIDEIDLHLHPSWQEKLIKALKSLFPHTQFILTTHSPHILQGLDRDEIIPLTFDEDGNPSLKKMDLGPYGLQGWTVEEILKYVMELPDTTSELYTETLRMYDEAMNREDGEEILKQYAILKEMLHPGNVLNKLLDLQVAEWEE